MAGSTSHSRESVCQSKFIVILIMILWDTASTTGLAGCCGTGSVLNNLASRDLLPALLDVGGGSCARSAPGDDGYSDEKGPSHNALQEASLNFLARKTAGLIISHGSTS